MGTSALIGKMEDGEFTGRSVHFDGYPSGVGHALVMLSHDYESPTAMIDDLLAPNREFRAIAVERDSGDVIIERYDDEDDFGPATWDERGNHSWTYVVRDSALEIIRTGMYDEQKLIDWDDEDLSLDRFCKLDENLEE